MSLLVLDLSIILWGEERGCRTLAMRQWRTMRPRAPLCPFGFLAALSMAGSKQQDSGVECRIAV